MIRGGHNVDSALTPSEALNKLDKRDYDVVFYELRLSSEGGLGLLHHLREKSPTTAIVILYGLTPLAASGTLGEGVYEYLAKPFDSNELEVTLNRALQRRSIMSHALQTKKNESLSGFDELVGNGPAMWALFQLITKVAPTGAIALLIGKVGTGRRLAAEAIHRVSNRRAKPFISVSANLVSRSELTELLLGKRDRSDTENPFTPGKIAAAESGTLYLDEISMVDRWGQTQLLSAIRNRQYLPVNGIVPQPATCRFIFGTSRDLGMVMEQDNVVEELYRQISVFPIYLPTLAERSEDIPALTYKFLNRYAVRFGKDISQVDDRLMTRLIARRWPGNIHELERCIERMVAICDDKRLTLQHYQEAIENSDYRIWDGEPPMNIDDLKRMKKQLRHQAVAEIERAFVTDALQRNSGNVTRAAEAVGMHRRNFQTLMRIYGIKAGGSL